MDKNKFPLTTVEDYNGFTFETLVGGENKVFEIPLFQRNYSWNPESCEQLFNDILDAFLKNEKYYIGNFMFYSSTEDLTPNYTKFILIDGQQRITSILLLLCAIRDTFPKMSCINSDFLINQYAPEQYRCKLKQNYNDVNDFNEIIDGKIDSKKKSAIYDAYNKFVSLINDCKDITPSNVKKLYNTIKNLETIGISFPNKDISKVQDIFEKINSTGVELSSADLIRNFLLFSSSTKTQVYLHGYWKVIEDIVGENKISKFAKSFLIRHIYEDVNNDKIYAKFKKEYANSNHEEVLKDLIHYAVFYAMIEKQEFYEFPNADYKNPIRYDFSDIGSRKYNQLSTLKTTFTLLNDIGTDEINPFFFQLCDSLYPNNIEKLDDICQLILEFMIRYRIVQPSPGGGSLSNKIRKIMKKINGSPAKLSKKSIYAMLSENNSSDEDDNINTEQNRYPDNEEFIVSLQRQLDAANARVALYQYARRTNQELIDFKKITLEHLMPQKINPDKDDGKWWIDHLGGKDNWQRVHDLYLNCIGNFGILTKSLNSSASNSPWPDKRLKIQEKAMDNTTREAAETINWTENEIKARNENLATEISKVITGPKYENSDDFNWLL